MAALRIAPILEKRSAQLGPCQHIMLMGYARCRWANCSGGCVFRAAVQSFLIYPSFPRGDIANEHGLRDVSLAHSLVGAHVGCLASSR